MSRGTTLEVNVTMVTEDCCNCGVMFALTQELKNELLSSKRDFYCPNGHRQHYLGESDDAKIKRLQRERDAERENAENAWKQHDAEKRRRAKAERELKTAKPMVERAKRAVCPAPGCKRQIVQMKRHLDTCHPDFVAEHQHV